MRTCWEVVSTSMSRLNEYRDKKQKWIKEKLKPLDDLKKSTEHWQKVVFFFGTNVVMGAVDYIQDFILAQEYFT